MGWVLRPNNSHLEPGRGGERAPLQYFRRFHRLKPTQCHRSNPADASDLDIDYFQLQLAVFGAPAQIGGNPKVAALMAKHGCETLFSGLAETKQSATTQATFPWIWWRRADGES